MERTIVGHEWIYPPVVTRGNGKFTMSFDDFLTNLHLAGGCPLATFDDRIWNVNWIDGYG